MLLLMFVTTGCCGKPDRDSALKEQIGAMLVVGFRGTELSPDSHIVSDIRDLHIGGVILFDYDVPSCEFDRNIVSPAQLKRLIGDLKSLAGSPLIVSIDQEGGMVDRLKPRYGFPQTISARKLGAMNNRDSTERYAALTAATLEEAGININFAPCVDLDVNPQCPIIGLKERSFSADAAVVTDNARWWLEKQQALGVVGCLKHFPGHGSSAGDTHVGAADVTDTWSEAELAPYKALIEAGCVHMVMTSHIYHANLDPDYPATMSRAILTGILREKLGFDGVIITDDLAMGALVDNYSLDQILEKAIGAGADLLCLSNNGNSYDPEIARKAVDIIFGLVKSGKIERGRIEASYVRIQRLKERF